MLCTWRCFDSVLLPSVWYVDHAWKFKAGLTQQAFFLVCFCFGRCVIPVPCRTLLFLLLLKSRAARRCFSGSQRALSRRRQHGAGNVAESCDGTWTAKQQGAAVQMAKEEQSVHRACTERAQCDPAEPSKLNTGSNIDERANKILLPSCLTPDRTSVPRKPVGSDTTVPNTRPHAGTRHSKLLLLPESRISSNHHDQTLTHLSEPVQLFFLLRASCCCYCSPFSAVTVCTLWPMGMQGGVKRHDISSLKRAFGLF